MSPRSERVEMGSYVRALCPAARVRRLPAGGPQVPAALPRRAPLPPSRLGQPGSAFFELLAPPRPPVGVDAGHHALEHLRGLLHSPRCRSRSARAGLRKRNRRLARPRCSRWESGISSFHVVYDYCGMFGSDAAPPFIDASDPPKTVGQHQENAWANIRKNVVTGGAECSLLGMSAHMPSMHEGRQRVLGEFYGKRPRRARARAGRRIGSSCAAPPATPSRST